jgi:hypothetical protein
MNINATKAKQRVRGECRFSRSENHKARAEIFRCDIRDLFKHSWRPILLERWVWVEKPMVMGACEFPVRLEEIRRFGHKARQVFRVHKLSPLSRSFAKTVREGGMSREYD